MTFDHHDPDNQPTDPIDDMNEGEVKAENENENDQ
jgi:hypothetical protein